jgi:hypothetical protein
VLSALQNEGHVSNHRRKQFADTVPDWRLMRLKRPVEILIEVGGFDKPHARVWIIIVASWRFSVVQVGHFLVHCGSVFARVE